MAAKNQKELIKALLLLPPHAKTFGVGLTKTKNFATIKLSKGGLMLKAEVLEKLKLNGVALHQGGMSTQLLGLATAVIKWPIASLWHESKEPTDEEIGLLGSFVRKHLGLAEGAPIEHGMIEGFNMVTFYKRDGQWTFRRLTWTEGPMWYPRSGTLEQILKTA